jgi:hypothetical protein
MAMTVHGREIFEFDLSGWYAQLERRRVDTALTALAGLPRVPDVTTVAFTRGPKMAAKPTGCGYLDCGNARKWSEFRGVITDTRVMTSMAVFARITA